MAIREYHAAVATRSAAYLDAAAGFDDLPVWTAGPDDNEYRRLFAAATAAAENRESLRSAVSAVDDAFRNFDFVALFGSRWELFDEASRRLGVAIGKLQALIPTDGELPDDDDLSPELAKSVAAKVLCRREYGSIKRNPKHAAKVVETDNTHCRLRLSALTAIERQRLDEVCGKSA